MTEYVKLRDVASVLNGTSAQFNVTWDGGVNLVPGEAYIPNGSEMQTPFSGERTFSYPTTDTKVAGQVVTWMPSSSLMTKAVGSPTIRSHSWVLPWVLREE